MNNKMKASGYNNNRLIYPQTNGNIPETYSRPSDVESTIALKVLDWLNSLSTPAEITNVVRVYAGERALSVRNAQRIFNGRKELGSFKDLGQVAAVPGIGVKKFSAIVNAFNSST